MGPVSYKPLEEKELFSVKRSLASVCYSLKLKNLKKYDIHQQGINIRVKNNSQQYSSSDLSGNIDAHHPGPSESSVAAASESAESAAPGAH